MAAQLQELAGTTVLESVLEPVLLRPWRDTDADGLLAISSSDPDLVRQMPQVASAEDAVRVIAERFPWSPEHVNAAIEVGGLAVGNVGVTNIRREGPSAGTAWVSYLSAADVRGRGFVGRATAALCTWALRDLGLARLELGYRENNPASAAVARRAGFVVEGLERQKLVYDGLRYDVVTCSRLASDPVPPAEAVTIQPA